MPSQRQRHIAIPDGRDLHPAARRRRDERGALTLFLAILFPALLAFAGLVVDAGTKLDNYENASTYAQEAARAGAGQVDKSAAYANSTFVVDEAEGIAAARAYLAAAGVSGTVTPVANNAIQVTVTITTPTKILSIIGIDTVTSTSTATASLISGVTGPGPDARPGGAIGPVPLIVARAQPSLAKPTQARTGRYSAGRSPYRAAA